MYFRILLLLTMQYLFYSLLKAVRGPICSIELFYGLWPPIESCCIGIGIMFLNTHINWFINMRTYVLACCKKRANIEIVQLFWDVLHYLCILQPMIKYLLNPLLFYFFFLLLYFKFIYSYIYLCYDTEVLFYYLRNVRKKERKPLLRSDSFEHLLTIVTEYLIKYDWYF